MRNRLITVEDTIESWQASMQAVIETAKSGGGLGINLRKLSKEKQEQFMREANEHAKSTARS